MNALIEFKKVDKMYPQENAKAIHDVSFAVAEGEFVCLIGPSGCGKTTILKLIAGLEGPTGGEVIRPQKVAMAFQNGALLPWLTVFENVALGLRMQGLSEHEIHHKADGELRAMGIYALAAKYPVDLSGGQRQRVGIARALAVDPAVLILDEPFSALDPKTTAELHEDVIRISQTARKTIVMVSHQIEEAVALADRIFLIREGRIHSEYPITLPFPRRENESFHHEVMKVRRAFFSVV